MKMVSLKEVKEPQRKRFVEMVHKAMMSDDMAISRGLVLTQNGRARLTLELSRKEWNQLLCREVEPDSSWHILGTVND